MGGCSIQARKKVSRVGLRNHPKRKILHMDSWPPGASAFSPSSIPSVVRECLFGLERSCDGVACKKIK